MTPAKRSGSVAPAGPGRDCACVARLRRPAQRRLNGDTGAAARLLRGRGRTSSMLASRGSSSTVPSSLVRTARDLSAAPARAHAGQRRNPHADMMRAPSRTLLLRNLQRRRHILRGGGRLRGRRGGLGGLGVHAGGSARLCPCARDCAHRRTNRAARASSAPQRTGAAAQPTSSPRLPKARVACTVQPRPPFAHPPSSRCESALGECCRARVSSLAASAARICAPWARVATPPPRLRRRLLPWSRPRRCAAWPPPRRGAWTPRARKMPRRRRGCSPRRRLRCARVADAAGRGRARHSAGPERVTLGPRLRARAAADRFDMRLRAGQGCGRKRREAPHGRAG